MAKKLEAWQRKALFGLGSSVGLVDNHIDKDNLHQLIESVTGKEHISELTFDEANEVIGCLKERMRGCIKQPPVRPAGQMTEGQRKKVWQQMYALQKLDTNISTASLGTRLCGIIKKHFGICATARDPFRWLSYKQGTQLIEILKQINRSVKGRDSHE